jgi:hypothetical protein
MIGSAVSGVVEAFLDSTGFAQTESFESPTGYAVMNGKSAVISIVTLVIMFGLILFLGKYLWNEVLTALVPGVKPAKNVWQILGLAILIALLYPGYCC